MSTSTVRLSRPAAGPAESARVTDEHVRVTMLPSVGPVWFSSVMGTGILATLLGREAVAAPALLAPALLTSAVTLLVVCVALLVGLGAAFTHRVVRDRDALTATLRDRAVVPTWGTVSMGVLATGSAVLTVAPQLGGAALDTWAVAVDAALWTAGTTLGVVTAFGFTAVLVRHDVGHPAPAWGLPLVPPMVSATTGAALLPHVDSPVAHLALIVASVACFVVSLFLGGLAFVLAYHHHWTATSLPVAASASAWIPLGVVGQSTAAAQALVAQSSSQLTPTAAEAAHGLANAYGYVMLALSVPVIAYAVRMTTRGFRARMPFSPGWWALTFPIGTLALGARLLGQATGNAAVGAVGVAAIVTLAGTWTFCAAATLRALRGSVAAGA